MGTRYHPRYPGGKQILRRPPSQGTNENDAQKLLIMENIPFQVIYWDHIDKTEYPGITGTAFWQTLQYKGLRLRVVEYSKGYLADHWCQKGHIVHCLEGAFTTELKSGEIFQLTAGMTYVVSDELSSHRSATETGVKLLIADGDFLKPV
jgi:hypothetical protein